MIPKLKKLTLDQVKKDVFYKDLSSVSDTEIILKVDSGAKLADYKPEPLLNLEITLQDCNRKGFFASK